MKKFISRKNVLKEAGVFLVAAMFVLTSIFIVPTIAQPVPMTMEQPADDVGVKSIDSPVNGCAGGLVPMKVTVENYGTNNEITDVQMEVLKCVSGAPLLEEHFNSWPPIGWTYNGYVQSNTNNAGGTSPEAYYGYTSYVSNGYIMTPPVDVSNYCCIILEFNLSGYFVTSFDFSFYVNWTNDDGVSWHDVTPWDNPVSANIGPSQFSIKICCGCGDCGNNFQVKWDFDGYYYYLQYSKGIYLDDVIIKGGSGFTEYSDIVEDVSVPSGSEISIQLGDWTPSDWGNPTYECSDVTYCVKACTLLVDDNPENDCKSNDITLYFDTKPPITTHTFNPPTPNGLHGWYVSCITVKLDATDNCSGVYATYYRLDNGAWNVYTAPFKVCDCKHTLDYYSVDKCGNVEPVVHAPTIKVDTVKPTLTFKVFKIPLSPYHKICLFICYGTSNDQCSGIDRVEIYRDTIYLERTKFGPGFFFFILIRPCNSTITAIAYDMAGNHTP
jgi:hypothetical protein